MRKRRLVSLLLAASLAASALAGCGSGGKTETTAAAAGGQTEAAGGTAGETGAAGGTAGETGAAGGTSAADLGTPLADVRVRQALAYAIDMNAIVDSLFEGKAEVAKSFTAPGDWLNAGIPVYEYNPEKAKELLAASELSLSEIAQEIGYTDQSYFGKVFKKQTGYSPHTYRNRAKRQGEKL